MPIAIQKPQMGYVCRLLAIRVNGSLLVRDYQTEFQCQQAKKDFSNYRSWGLYGMKGELLGGDITSEDVRKFMETFLNQKTF